MNKAERRRLDRIAAKMRKSPRRDRYFGPTKILYHLEGETVTRNAADLKAAQLRRRHPGYGVRVTRESGKYQVWQAHFAGR